MDECACEARKNLAERLRTPQRIANEALKTSIRGLPFVFVVMPTHITRRAQLSRPSLA